MSEVNINIHSDDIDESKIDDSIKEKVQSVKNELVNSSLYQEYTSLKKAISESESLQKAFNLEKYLRKCKMSQEEKEEYDANKQAIVKDPLISNYKVVEKDLEQLLNEIKDTLDI